LLELGKGARTAPEVRPMRALAGELGLSEAATRRLVLHGPPRSWRPERVERLASELLARAHDNEQARSEEAKAELARRRKLPVYSLAARQAMAVSLRAALGELERRKRCEPGTWSPRASLAGELGVTSVRIGRWLASGSVPEDSMPEASSWAEARAERQLRQMAEQGHVEALIEQAKTPAYAHTLPGAPRQFAARAPDMKTKDRRTESEAQSGYQWDRRVERWSSFELIDELCAWAASRKRPAGMLVGRFWIVTALCTIYHPRGRRPGKTKSPGAIRQFERKTDRERGRDLSLGVPVSSRTVKRGGLERAVRLFRESITIEHCEHDQVFVHGILVRNWRIRSSRDQANYRHRVQARLLNEQALQAQKKERQRMKKREAARKKALARRGSAAGSSSPRGGAPVGARRGGKKRS
jgi:hypothetical protein